MRINMHPHSMCILTPHSDSLKGGDRHLLAHMGSPAPLLLMCKAGRGKDIFKDRRLWLIFHQPALFSLLIQETALWILAGRIRVMGGELLRGWIAYCQTCPSALHSYSLQDLEFPEGITNAPLSRGCKDIRPSWITTTVLFGYFVSLHCFLWPADLEQ